MLINTEFDYNRSQKIVAKTLERIENQRKNLAAKGLPKDHIERALGPSLAFVNGIADEVKWYECAKRGKIPPVQSLEDIGRTLIALRIAHGMTQTELAQKLGISQAQVSQDEDDEYHGIAMERAQKIMSVFGARIEARVILKAAPKKAA